MDSGLKQRLLGAAVLIALAIIFVPMFLGNSPPRETSAIQNLDIPPLPERKFETRTLPIEPAKPAAAPAPAAPPNPDKIVTVDTKAPPSFEAPDKPAEKGAPADKATPAAPAPTPKPMSASEAKPSAPEKPSNGESAAPAAPATAGGRFTVNLGIYADQGHADALIARLKKTGYNAFAEPTEYQGKPAQRVRVGPYASRADAEAARLKIKQIDPKLPTSVSESAEANATDQPATALPANRAGGWAVQLGAFKSEAEANKLRDRARVAGIATFVDKTGSDQPLWRVRAGPYAERPGAEAARATLKAKLQADGVVVTLP